MTADVAWFRRIDTATRPVSRPEPVAKVDTSFSRDASGRLSEPSLSWKSALDQLEAILELKPDWDSYGGSAPSQATFAYAVAELSSLKAMDLPPPVIGPSGDGHILASWSGGGIEVELWFQGPYQELALIDDERGEVEPISGPDPLLVNVASAIRKIRTRP
jgi:hypothetical protein